MTLVGSIKYTSPDIDRWQEWESSQDEGCGVLEHLSLPENFITADSRYGSTKLLMQYAFEEW